MHGIMSPTRITVWTEVAYYIDHNVHFRFDSTQPVTIRVIETKLWECLEKGEEEYTDYTERKKKWEQKHEHPPTYTHCDKLFRLGMDFLKSPESEFRLDESW